MIKKYWKEITLTIIFIMFISATTSFIVAKSVTSRGFDGPRQERFMDNGRRDIGFQRNGMNGRAQLYNQKAPAGDDQNNTAAKATVPANQADVKSNQAATSQKAAN